MTFNNNIISSLPKDPLAYLWKFLSDKEVWNVSLAFRKVETVQQSARKCFAERTAKRLAPDIYRAIDKPTTVEGAVGVVGALCIYLASGVNARERYEAVKDKAEITQWMPAEVLRQFSEREAKSQDLIEFACGGADDKVIEELTKDGIWINARCSGGETALHQTTTVNKVEVVETLLNHGANVNAVNADHATPLHSACIISANKIAEFLIKRKGADLNIVDKDGQTALHKVVQYSPLKNENTRYNLVKQLIDAGADMNVRARDGKTALEDAVHLSSNNWRAIDLLLERGAQVEDLGELLRWAAVYGDRTMVEVLINHGADVTAADEDGQTALHWVVKVVFGTRLVNPIGTAELLLHKGADINAVDNGGRTPLACTFREYRPKMHKFLVENGAIDTVWRRKVRLAVLALCVGALLLIGIRRLWKISQPVTHPTV